MDRRRLLLILAVFVAVIGTALVFLYVKGADGRAKDYVASTPVLVATQNIEDLAHDFMLLVPDIPGSGESASPPAPISADSIGATLAAGVTSIIGPQTGFAVAGFSMGGLIAGYLVRHAGAQAQCLVLVGATGTGAPRGPMAPLKSWRRLATEAEKTETHRHNLGILMIHDPGKIDALAVHVQKANAERSRIRGKHVSHTGVLSECRICVTCPAPS